MVSFFQFFISIAELERIYLVAKFTEAANFGGGDEDGRRDRKTVIEELINESKMRKVERARDHEEVLDLTNKLDSDWKDLFPVVNKLQREDNERVEPDEYDRLVKEMIFAPRGEPTEKLKNEEEVARMEKERLMQLERDRLRRMKGDEGEERAMPEQPKYRSADDLDDYFLEPVYDQEDERTLSYPLNAEDDQGLAEQSKVAKLTGFDRESSDEEQEGDGVPEESGSEEASDEESEADSLDDLKGDQESEDEDSDSSEDEECPPPKVLKISTEEPSKAKAEKTVPKVDKKEMEKLDRIPYSINVPESYEDLMALMEKESSKVQGVVLDRIIKTNHPKLMMANRNKMHKLFAYLLQYVNDLFSSVAEAKVNQRFKVLKEIAPFMYDLVQMNPDDASKCFLEVMKEKYDDFLRSKRNYPKLDTLVFFQLLGSFFSISDFRHPVVTPAFVFLHQILSDSRIKTRSDLASGLFLVTLLLDSQKLSQKFLPSAMNFLCGIFFLGSSKPANKLLKPLVPFGDFETLLTLDEKFKGEFSSTMAMQYSDLSSTIIDEEFKVRALLTAVNLYSDFIKLYDNLVGVKYLLDGPEKLLARLRSEKNLPKEFRQHIVDVIKNIQDLKASKTFVYPTPERKVQPMLRLLEPRFETVLSDRRVMFSQAEGPKLEQQKLRHMVKREFKSARRELRRDNEFINKIRHKRKEQLDRERKDKVKRIFNEASIQQSEYKANIRTKGRKSKF